MSTKTKNASRAKATRGKKKVAPEVKEYVKKTISRNIENLHAAPIGSDAVDVHHYSSTATGSVSTIIDLLQVCQLSQGDGQGDRHGNEVKSKKLLFKGYLTNFVAVPVMVRMIIFRRKDQITIPTSFTDLLQNGNTTQAPTNLPRDMFLNLNKDDYTIYKQRMFKLGSLGSPGSVDANGLWYTQIFKYDLAKFVKRIQFNDSAVNVTNHGMYCAFLLCKADGTPLIVSDVLAKISYNLEYEYEDA